MDFTWFTDFTNWLAKWFKWFGDLAESMVLTIFAMLKDLFFWMIKTVIDLAVGFFNQLTDGHAWDLSRYITSLPPEITQALGALGFGNCMAIVGSALLIRFLMGLVPFIRLGR